MKTIPFRFFALPILASLFLAGCGEDDTSEASSSASSSASSEIDPGIEAVFVDAKPSDAITVSEARKTAKPGDAIAVSGKIAGAMSPFTDGFATVVLSDVALKTCDLIPGDECRTPWDACCEDPKIIKSSRLTIQIIGDDSRPVGQSLKGINGLKELDPLVVAGVVAEGSNAENMIVNVTGLYQVKK